MNNFADVYEKYKTHLSRVGHSIILERDNMDRKWLKKAHRSVCAYLRGHPLYLTRRKAAKYILYVLSNESQTYFLCGEVESLTSIIACTCNDVGTSRDYARRLTGELPVYVNLTSELIPATN